jgi:CheY-like chemotaxis protein
VVKKILVVDDEADILSSVKMLLDTDGYEVKTVSSGKGALGLLKKENFDLIVCDIMMPEMSGNELCEKIRKDPKTKNQKIVFLSVVTLGEEGKAQLNKIKPLDYIQKPFNNADFKKRIKKVLDKK